MLTPKIRLDPGFVTAGDGSTGQHVMINDGQRRIRVALLQRPGPTSITAAIQTLSGYEPASSSSKRTR